MSLVDKSAKIIEKKSLRCGSHSFFTLAVLLISCLSITDSAKAGSLTVERVSLFANNGAEVSEDRREPAVHGSFSNIGVDVIAFEKNISSANRIEWKWRLKNVSGSAIRNLRLTGYIDVDVSAQDNSFFNETALKAVLTAPAGEIAADRWEAGEPGYWTGALLSRTPQGNLRNASHASTAGDDIAFAISAVSGNLEANQEITARLILDDDGASGLQQKDNASNDVKSVNLYLQKGTTPAGTYSVDYAVQHTTSTPAVNLGGIVEYEISLSNQGLTDGTGATLLGEVPAQITNVKWTCRAEGNAECLTPSGSGNKLFVKGLIPKSIGSRIVVTLRGTGSSNASVNHIVAAMPTSADTIDINPQNNSSSASVLIGSGVSSQADLAVDKTTSTPLVAGNGSAVFQIVVTNKGPDAAVGARLRDIVPPELRDVTWKCVAASGGQCSANLGTGSIVDLALNLPKGATVTVDVTGKLQQTTNNVVNTATVSSDSIDPVLSNNSSSASINATSGIVQPIPTTGWGTLLLMSIFTALTGWVVLVKRGKAKGFLHLLLPSVFAVLFLSPSDSHAIFLNGDFETQNFDGWTKRFGTNPGLGGSPPFQVTDVRVGGGGANEATIVDGSFDPRAPQLVLPRQGNFSAKVNDEINGAHLNEISQKGEIFETDRDPGDGKLHVRFSYAAVLEDPGHEPTGQPYFFVELKDLTKGETLYYDFAFANQPGRFFYTTIVKGSKWVSTPFIDVDLVLPDDSLGHNFQIRVVGADCAHSGHGGYVYVDAFGSVSIPPQGACIDDLKARSKPGNVQLTWSDNGAASYAIYRAEKLEGPYVRVATTQSRFSTWLDRSVQPRKIYHYSVRSLDIDGNELCSSGEVVTVVPEHWSVGDPVSRPPIFVSAPVLAGDIRAPYEYEAVAVDADGDALTYQLMYAPVNMTVAASTGKITWQPGLAGNYRVNLQVSDSTGLLASQAFSINVVDGNLPPKITSQFPNKVPVGVTYTHQVMATDPENGPLQYTVGSQAVGLTIGQSGQISWASPQPGTYPLSIQVTDQYGARDVQRLVVVVQAFPEFTSLPVATATAGQPYAYQALATDKDGDVITYGVLAGPTELVIDAATGLVNWPSPVAGSTAVTLGATDPDGNLGKQSFAIRVTAAPNRAPVFTATPVTYVAYPSEFSYTASASDADGDNLTWKLLQSPADMKVNERTGAISWKFSNNLSGKFPVRVQVDDRRGGLTEQSFEILVPVYGNGAPTITSRPVSQVRAGSIYSYVVAASDPERELLTYRLATGPAVAAWNGNQLSWQTSAADVGVREMLIEVADSSGNTTQQNWQLEVVPASGNQPPVISSSPRVTAAASASYEYQLLASDRDGDALSYTLVVAPATMTISAAGKVEWSVPAGLAGSEPVEIKVSDGKGGEVTQSYSIGVGITANRPPLINSTPIVTATAGSTYRYQISASDPDSDTLSYSVSTNEPGVSIDASTGLVSWNVPSVLNSQVQLAVMVTDGKGGVASQTYTIDVGQAGNRPPRVTTQPGTTGVSGIQYVYALRASDADGDTLTYALLEFPQGMAISSTTGDISWSIAADVAGMAPVTVEVSDGKGGRATQGYAISVAGASNRAPTFTSSPVTSATAGAAYAYSARASDPDGDVVTYSLATSSSGMVVNAQTGAITWTPTLQQSGENPVAVRATDTKFAYTTQSFSVYVQLSTNNPPQISSQPMMRGSPGIPYQYQVVATDPDQNALAYSLETAPSGMTISAATGLVAWNTPVLGTHQVEIKVQDTRGAYVVQRYSLQIAANRGPVITSAPTPTGTVGTPYSYQVSATDPDGDFLTYRMTGAPAELSISATGLISGTPTAQGTHAIAVTVSDGQSGATQSWTLRMTHPAAGGPLQASVTPTPKYLNLGESTTLQVFAEGGTGPYTVNTLTVDGRAVAVDASYKATFIPIAIGKHNVRLSLRDAKGITVTVEEWFGVKDPSDTLAPQAVISAPGTSTDIMVTDVFEPTTISGTASDANLAEHVLLISAAGKNQWSRIGGGATSVTNAKLGDLESQTLANGLYDIALIVRDFSGNEASAKVTVAINGHQKAAPLQLTFTDMSFELEGLPLTVRRTYDSLKRTQRMDFGYGWTVDYQDVWLQTNGVLGRSWVLNQTGSGFNRKMCVLPQGSRVASIRLPDGHLEQFEMRASPECVSTLQWASNPTVSLAFTPKSSNKSGSSLQALGYSDLRIVGGDLFDMGATETFNPSQYKLTLLDGTEYILNKDFGVQQIKDRRGNQLQFTRNGISHSGGWALNFTRDAAGKITRITGPGNQAIVYGYDDTENLTTVVDQVNAASNFRYENAKVAHGLTSYTDPLGRLVLKTTYDDAGRMLSQTDGAGRVVTVNTDNTAKRQTVKDRNGNTMVYDFDERGNVTRVVDAAGGVTHYAYDANDNEIEVTDPLGRKTARTYDAYGNVTSETDSAGRQTQTAFNGQGNITTMTDPAGRATTNGYNGTGDLTTITDPAGKAFTIGYTPAGSLGSLVDKSGNTTRYTYAKFNGATLKQTETAPDGTVTTYAYDSAGNVASTSKAIVTQPNQPATTIVESTTYDAKGNLTSRTNAAGDATTYQYDAANQLTQETDSQGRKTTHEYTQRGEKSKTTYPDGRNEAWTYDNNGNETRSCKDSLCTSTAYDALDRATKATDAMGFVVETTYDAAGQETTIKDARGNSTAFEYDQAGRAVKQTNAAGNTTTMEYDLAGNLVKTTDGVGNLTVSTFDNTNKRTSVTLATGAATQYAYDANGVLLAETNPLGHRYQFAYDSLGTLKTVTDPLGKAAGYTWNGQNQLLTQTDANGHASHYGYDSAGRRVARTLPGGGSEAMVYDSEGRVITRTDFDGSQTNYSYDTGGKLTKTTRVDGKTLTIGYDGYGRINSQIDTAYGNLNLTQDANSRITRETWSHNALGSSFSASIDYAWDSNNNRTQVSTTGQTIKAGYNALNQLDALTHPDGSVTRFTYDKAGNRTQVIRADGSTSVHQYNAANQLTAVIHQKPDGTEIASFVYTLNAAGQRTQVVERMEGIGEPAATVQRTVVYSYDAAGKLVQEQIAQTTPAAFASTIDYLYDAAGNRSKRSISHNGQVTTYQYDANDRLTQSTDSAAGTSTYQWDPRGNLVGQTAPSGTTAYDWTVDNRLAKVSLGAKTVEYGYDSSGRRIKRLIKEGANTIETHYKVDHQRPYSEIIVESTKLNNGTWADKVHIHTPDGVGDLIASTGSSPGSTQYYGDGLGSVRVAKTATGHHGFSYDAFGIELGADEGMPSNAAQADDIHHSYTGEYVDQSTGLMYLRARDYDPKVGRFISMDEHQGSKRIPLTLNKYLYGNADPVNTIDPGGNFGMTMVMPSMSIGLNLSAVAGYGGILTSMGARLLLAYGVGALSGSSSILINSRSKNQARDKLKEKVESVVRSKGKNNRDSLYHYTDRTAAMEIFATQEMYCSSKYNGHLTSRVFPAGVYATDIEPWDPLVSLKDFGEMFFGGSQMRDLSWFVALNGEEFYPLSGHQFVRQCSAGSTLPVSIYYFGPNLMD